MITMVGLVVRDTDLTANKAITLAIDFVPAGAAFIVRRRLDVSPARFELYLTFIYSLQTLRVELEVSQGTNSFHIIRLVSGVPPGTGFTSSLDVIEFLGVL
eukprot:TRINITY_DN1051_c0_g1_i7.p1 TRINITY_DN1051_c0_g1~~TRINITY_DN1051_c0_g1_i7.p1  ORF type:complete len:101 (-),score=10.99 TRINITY_DN1051_c0_g1_i7:513-815(-)